MANETRTVLVFKDEHGLREVEILDQRLVNKKTKEALARLKCLVNFEPYMPCDNRGYTLYGCRLKEIEETEDGELIHITYERKVYDDEEE